ncbi:MAG: TatD family hydrolase [Flavobacteriaceae bacterium]|nr:TatD family hydrolase [Flavobacteriaceae bacterium]
MYFDIHHHSERKNGIFNLDLGEQIPKGYFSVGLHPQKINSNFEKDWSKIKEISLNPYCVAVGECGLDALVEADEDLQEKVFEMQILWANEIQKPVIVHCVRRFSQLLKFQKIAKTPMIIHGFNKKENIAKDLLGKGFYLSFGKSLLYNENLQNIAKEIPLEKIFLETDTSQEKIENIYFCLAKIKNIPLEMLQNQMLKNVEKVWGNHLKLVY